MSSDAGAANAGLAVLVVAYRSADKLERCLLSADQHLPGCEIYVWDNSGPSHSDVRELAGRHQRVHWHVNSANIGFAAAVNRLATLVPHQDMLLLNPDAEVLGPLTLTQAAMRACGVAAVAPMVSEGTDYKSTGLFSSENMPWDVAHRKPNWLNVFCETIIRNQRLRGTAFSSLYRHQPSDVEGYLTGACLAISREAWDSVGPFDEEFFLYGEEADWQRRAVAAGWRIHLANEVGVRHSGHGTVAGNAAISTRSYDLLRAGLALQLEYQYGRFVSEAYLVVVSLIEAARRRVRPRRDKSRPGYEVMVTINAKVGTALADQSVSVATELARHGYAVSLISLRRFGSLPRDVPTDVRLLRRPWWWPSTAPETTAPILVCGITNRERAFARLFRLRRHRLCVRTSSAIDRLTGSPHLRRVSTQDQDLEDA